MSPKHFLIAGNWKMNTTPAGFEAPDSPYRPHPKVEVAVFPTNFDIARCLKAGLPTGGQFGRPEDTGAYTGDVSMKMLKDAGCAYVLCGHSDRRNFHQESDEFIAEQARSALKNLLIPIVCIGETEKERDAGQSQAVVTRQFKAIPEEVKIIAYEPVWAISRGDPNKPAATPQDAQQMHALIRSLLPDNRKTLVRLLYGGSMKGDNAKELLSQPDIDGGLVGGASLKPDDFRKIVEAAAGL
jgi:triosephosphate isomerase (TIM)